MSKVYVIQINMKIDGEARILNVFARAESKAKAIKSVVTARLAKVDDFMPDAPPAGDPVPSSQPEPSNE